MKLKGLTHGQLTDAVETVSKALYSGNIIFKREPEKQGNFLVFTVTVKTSGARGGRRSHTGRRVAAACWHAHRDIMQAIFAINPDALLITALARYEGRGSFLSQFEGTGGLNIGSIMAPLCVEDACDCADTYHAQVADSIYWSVILDRLAVGVTLTNALRLELKEAA